MTPVEKLQLKNAAMRVLHTPGGPLAAKGPSARTPVSGEAAQAAGGAGCALSKPGAGKAPLEMTLVFDRALSAEEVKTAGADVIFALKSADEIFRNVRCNVVWWHSDEKIIHEVTAAPMIQMGRCFENWQPDPTQKRLELLMADLKKFQARSRLIIIVTKQIPAIGDGKLLHDSLNPFLYHRVILKKENGLVSGRELLQMARERMSEG